MRKLLAILLLSLFGFGYVSPLLAYTSSSEDGLPACCRRNGHHCMGMQVAMAKDTHANHVELRAKQSHCPCCGMAGTSATHLDALSGSTFLSGETPRSTRSGILTQSSTRLRFALAYAPGKRGPPSPPTKAS